MDITCPYCNTTYDSEMYGHVQCPFCQHGLGIYDDEKE